MSQIVNVIGRAIAVSGAALRASVAAVGLAAILGFAAAGSAAAHDGSHATLAGQPPRADVNLRGCWLTVALIPASAEALENAFREPLVLTQTFYGPDPLVGIWGLACERARVEDKRIDHVTLSLVGAPTGLTADGALPLANNFAHALLRADTDSRALARALRRAGLPGRRSDTRYRHSGSPAPPSSGELVVPGRYRIDVAARELDPTNPHDHVNSFSSVGSDGRRAVMDLFIDDAFDRFCIPTVGGCNVFVRAHRRSPVRDLLGDGSTVARAGFDHAEIKRVKLVLD